MKAVFGARCTGPVVGYARVAGSARSSPSSQKRSSAGRETTDQIFFQRLTFGRVHSARPFIQAAAATPQTFNSFYADKHDIAFVTTGRLPNRPQGRQPATCRSTAAAKFEWRGFLKASQAPAGRSTRPAACSSTGTTSRRKNFPAGDDRWDEGGTQRVDWLLRRPRAGAEAHARHRARRGQRGRDGGPARPDVADGHGRARQGTAPSPLAQQAVDQITAWSGGRRELGRRERRRLDRRARPGGDGGGLGRGSRAPRSAAGSASRSARRSRRAQSRFQRPPSGMYGGWHQYIAEGPPRAARRSRSAAGSASATAATATSRRCAADLWAAIEAGAHGRRRRRRGRPTSRPGTADGEDLASAPLPLVTCSTRTGRAASTRCMQFAP